MGTGLNDLGVSVTLEFPQLHLWRQVAESKDSIASEAGMSWSGFASSCPWIYICSISLCASSFPTENRFLSLHMSNVAAFLLDQSE